MVCRFETVSSEDVLDRSLRRDRSSHILAEKQHIGVLTGSEFADMKITLIAGRAHLKHTEGGDFRQATYRALRQGLRSAACTLLEPVYEFRIELPLECAGRAMTDIQKMHGSFSPMEIEGENAVLKGTAPVVTMRGYQTELISYTKGKGRMTCSVSSYQPCHNAEEVIKHEATIQRGIWRIQRDLCSVHTVQGLWSTGIWCRSMRIWIRAE